MREAIKKKKKKKKIKKDRKKEKERKKEKKRKQKWSPTNGRRYLQMTHAIRGYYAKHIESSYNST